MTEVRLYRVAENLTGKRLNAHTIATLLAVQGVRSASELSTAKVMNAEALLFLNRPTAMRYWMKNAWLEKTEQGAILTPSGKDKAIRRMEGRDGAQSVSPDSVADALSVILHGNGSAEPAIETKLFDL
jgi:hypothetical protein